MNHTVSALTMMQYSITYNSSPTKIYEVNVVQSASSPRYGQKNESKNKSKKNNNLTENPKTQTQPHDAEKKTKETKICLEDHYTRYFPHREEVSKIFKGNS